MIMKLYILILLLMALVLRLTRAILLEPPHIPLTFGVESGPHITPCNMYGYFKVQTVDACGDLHIELRGVEGQPNLYVSKAPNKYPKYRSLAWSSYDWEDDKVVISSWDPDFEVGTYYISVHAYCGDDVKTKYTTAKYTLTAYIKIHQHPYTKDLFNGTESGRLTSHRYHYYRACLPNPCYMMRVKLQNCVDVRACPNTYAWPELLISRSKENVTMADYAWRLGDTERRYIDIDPTSDPSVKPGHYYIAVYGWCTPEEHCEPDTHCGPCDQVDQAPYNISVKPVPVQSSQCTKFKQIKDEQVSQGTAVKVNLFTVIFVTGLALHG